MTFLKNLWSQPELQSKKAEPQASANGDLPTSGAIPVHLPTVPPLLPLTQTECSEAFWQAATRVRRLRRMPEETLQLNNLIAQQCTFPATDFEQSDNSLGRHFHGHLVHLKNGWYAKNCMFRSNVQLDEVLASQLAWDIGLPHSVYGIACGLSKGQWSVFSIAPKNSFTEAGKITEPHTPQGRKSWDCHDTLVEKVEELKAPLAAMAAFDLWIRNPDRHLNNVLVLDVPTTRKKALFGIDFDRVWLAYDDDEYLIRPGVQNWLAKDEFGAAPMLSMLSTLDAIESYPASRLKALIDRMAPVVPPNISLQERFDKLTERQGSVREQMAELLGRGYRDQVLNGQIARISAWRTARRPYGRLSSPTSCNYAG